MATTWTDEQLLRWTIDAEEDIVSKLALRTEPFSLEITSGTGTYTFNSRIKEVLSVTWKGKPVYPLIGSEARGMFSKYREIDGEPVYYQMSNEGINTVRFIPVPNEDVDEYTTGLDGANIENAVIIRGRTFTDRDVAYFQIPSYLHRNLIKCYVLKKAFSVEGIGQNLRAANYWGARYQMYLDALTEAKESFYSTVEQYGMDDYYCGKKKGIHRPFDRVISGHILNLSAANLVDGFSLSDALATNLEVDASVLQAALGSDLNSWDDALAAQETPENLFQSLSDDLDNWADAFTTDTVAALSQSFSDDLNNWGDSNSVSLNAAISQPDSTWLFDEGSGTTAADSSGSFDASLPSTGETWATEGLTVNDDACGIGNNYDQVGNTAFSVSVVMMSVNTGGFQDLVGKQLNSGTTRKGWVVFIDTDDLWFFLQNDNSAAERIQKATNANIIADNTYYHLCVTYSGSEDAAGVKFYKNGVEQTTTFTYNDTLNGSCSNTNAMALAGRTTGVTTGLVGDICIVRFWDGVELSASEVSDWYDTDESIMSGRGVTL